MNPRKLLDWRKLLIYSHRWMGIVLGLVFVSWFVSGILFVYWGEPHITAQERLERMEALDLSTVRVSPAEAARAAGMSRVSRLRVAMLGGRPVYRLQSGKEWTAVYADTGEAVEVNGRQALELLRRFIPEHGSTIQYDAYLPDSDQWTLESAVRDLMPLHRLSTGDAAGTQYYVSQGTGDVVMRTDRGTRVKGYLSAVLHWLYFTPLRRHGPFWSQFVIWISLIGCVMCVGGIAIGVWRYSIAGRFRLKGSVSHSPYTGMMKWHHYAGLLFGVFTFTWALSGALSLTPFSFLRGTSASRAERDAAAGGPVRLEPVTVENLRAVAAEVSESFIPKELDFLQFRAEPFFIAYRPSPAEAEPTGRGSVSDFSSLQLNRDHVIVSGSHPERGCFNRFSDDEMVEVARAAMRGVPVQDMEWLNDYDAYYYNQNGSRPLPVLRIRFNDPERTWLYLNPQHGQMIRMQRMNRLNRWLYKGLHDLDFPFLYYRRPLWDIVIVGLSIGGLVVSATTLLPSYRRLRRRAAYLLSRFG
jgi:PepSY-associated TM region